MTDRSGRDERATLARRGLVVVALSLLVLVSGCLGPFGAPVAPADAPAPTSQPVSDRATPSGTAPTDRETPSSPATAESPWGTDPVIVAVESGDSRNVTPLVGAAAAYWNANASRYAGYPVELRVVPDAEDPDVVVRFVDAIPDCGTGEDVVDAAGCAPLVTTAPPRTAPVEVVRGLSDDSTVLVLKHEFGHLLGLTHADQPADVMQARTVLYTEPQVDAVDRAFPWRDATFSVWVDVANASDPAGARSQVDRALAYYEAGAPGMPSNVTFRAAPTERDAEIVVRYAATAPCGSGPGSCWVTRGPDPDGDGRIERYDTLQIYVLGVETDAVGWHVGYWLAQGLGAEDDAEKPPPFRDADYRDRRSEWWS
jgi:hypothetical protein